MIKLYRLLSVLMLVLLPAIASLAEPREALIQSSHKMVVVFDELSPVALPEEAWIPYSLCLVEALDSLGGELSTESLVNYIRAFDSDLYFPADLALVLDTQVIDPCMQHNPIATLSNGTRYRY